MNDPLNPFYDQRRERIRELNDNFRSTFVDGRILITPGVSLLAEGDRRAVFALVRAFTQFNADNDPHGEHDFISVNHDKTTYFAKIDYYDLSLEHASEDPSDTEKTVRVMLRADEY